MTKRRLAFPALGPALAAAVAVAAAPLAADIHPFPSTRPLVASQLAKGEAGLGAAWSGIASGGSSQIALTGAYGGFESLDLALSLIPTSRRSLVAGGDLLYTPWERGRWSAGLDLGGYLPIGGMETYHFDHGEVIHDVYSLRVGLDVRWRGLYFGTGYLHAWDRRDYDPATAPADSRAEEFAREHRVFSHGGSQQHLGLVLGEALRFRVEAALTDDTFYNLLIEPSDPTQSALLTLSAGITYVPGYSRRQPSGTSRQPAGGAGGPPAPDPAPVAPALSAAPPDTASRDRLFDPAVYGRGLRYGAAASLVGLVAGAAIGSTLDDNEVFLPPEVIMAYVGAAVTIPIGSAFGALTIPRNPRASRKGRPVLWTLAGTAAGAAAGFLLTPVTAGISLYFLTPLGTAMGYQYGDR